MSTTFRFHIIYACDIIDNKWLHFCDSSNFLYPFIFLILKFKKHEVNFYGIDSYEKCKRC